jgi:hypothetical protein
LRYSVFSVLTAAFLASAAAQVQAQPADTAELYHAHFAKAAPGKLNDLIDAYLTAPVPAGEQKPIILRHREGDDWDLLVLTPFGKAATTVSAAPPPADVLASYAKVRAASERHTDSFVSGPAWSEAQKAFTGEGVYVVGVYRSANGHRDQLSATLGKIAAADPPGRTLTLRHVEGGPFDVIQITHYDSWNDIDAQSGASAERMRAQGFATPAAASLELRQHMAEHHDTICTRVTK